MNNTIKKKAVTMLECIKIEYSLATVSTVINFVVP
jgi:hypothetical protein